MREILRVIFSEDNGNLSSMRLLTFFVIAVILFNWTWLNIQGGQIITFDWQEIALVLGPLFAKAYQKSSEQKVNRENEDE